MASIDTDKATLATLEVGTSWQYASTFRANGQEARSSTVYRVEPFEVADQLGNSTRMVSELSHQETGEWVFGMCLLSQDEDGSLYLHGEARTQPDASTIEHSVEQPTNGRYLLMRSPLRVGDEWREDIVFDSGARRSYRCEIQGREPVTVPAGTFNAFKVVSHTNHGPSEAVVTAWWCPELAVVVKDETSAVVFQVSRELVSYGRIATGFPREAGP